MRSLNKQHLKNYSRRSMLRNTGALVAGSSLVPLLGHSLSASAQATGELIANDINSSLSVISGAGSNVLVKKTSSDELIVVDGGLQEHGRDLRNFIRRHMDTRRFNTLVNTHWHPEQTGLNRILGDDVRLFAHENTRLWLGVEIERPWENSRFEPLPKSAQPNETFYHYGEFTEADTTMQYGYMLQAHTDGDMYAFFPEDNVLHTGGVISNDAWPVVDWWTGGWIGGMVDGIETILRVANEDTIIVPSSGPVMTYSEVEEMRDMYATIFNRIRELFMAANSPQETLDAKPTAEFDVKYGNSDQFVLLSHQSVLAHFAPDA